MTRMKWQGRYPWQGSQINTTALGDVLMKMDEIRHACPESIRLAACEALIEYKGDIPHILWFKEHLVRHAWIPSEWRAQAILACLKIGTRVIEFKNRSRMKEFKSIKWGIDDTQSDGTTSGYEKKLMEEMIGLLAADKRIS